MVSPLKLSLAEPCLGDNADSIIDSLSMLEQSPVPRQGGDVDAKVAAWILLARAESVAHQKHVAHQKIMALKQVEQSDQHQNMERVGNWMFLELDRENWQQENNVKTERTTWVSSSWNTEC